MSSAGASILGVGYLIPMVYLAWSMRYGKIAPANPWPATGLEWQTASPPPTLNFEQTPVVHDDVYDYPKLLESKEAVLVRGPPRAPGPPLRRPRAARGVGLPAES